MQEEKLPNVSRWSLLVPITLLVVASEFFGPVNIAYEYYVALRWVVCIASLYFAYQAYITKHQILRKTIILFLIPIAILFNPISPIILTKSTWVNIDFFVAVILAFIAYLLEDKKSPTKL